MSRHAVLTTVAVAAFSLSVLSTAGCAQDEQKSIQQKQADIRASAEAGKAEEQAILGSMYATGEGVPQDDAEAAAWFRKAAEQGYVNAQVLLGLMYDKGKGVPQDYVEAVGVHHRNSGCRLPGAAADGDHIAGAG